MRKIKSLKVFHQLSIGFGFLLLIILVVAGLGIERVERIDAMLTTVNDVNNAKSREAINYRGSVHDRAILIRDLIYADTLSEAKNYEAQIAELSANYKKADAAMDALFAKDQRESTDQEQQALRRIKSLDQSISPKIASVIDLRMTGKVTLATETLRAELSKDFVQWLAAINAFIDIQEAQSQALTNQANDLIAGFMVTVGGLALIGIAAGVLLATSISRKLMGDLGAEPSVVKHIAQQIAQGDLTVPVSVKKNDSHSLLAAMKAMKENLSDILAQVSESAERVTLASNQVSQSNEEISRRSEDQASSIEETSSTMEEITSTVKQNADNAREANELAQSARSVAERGGQVVQGVVNTMGEINESAKKIVDIISVIDSIAFQTNILALNAAVEAARAGEQGRGFAVVAAEVRTLAQRSATAAKEIKTLIDASVAKTANGTEQAQQAGATMQEVVQSVQNVTQIMAEITNASHEQALGIEQINQAVAQMDGITRNNTVLVQESARVSRDLDTQARELTDVVRQFKLSQLR